MAMSRKHYKAFAGVLRAERVTAEDWSRELCVARITQGIADVLAEDNPRFSAEKFMKAVETGEGL